jgi:hypothetical protein
LTLGTRVDVGRPDTSRRGFEKIKPPACSGPALEIIPSEGQAIRRKRKLLATTPTQSGTNFRLCGPIVAGAIAAIRRNVGGCCATNRYVLTGRFFGLNFFLGPSDVARSCSGFGA